MIPKELAALDAEVTESDPHRRAKLRIANLFMSAGWEATPSQLYADEAVESRMNLDGAEIGFKPDVVATKGPYKVLVEIDGKIGHTSALAYAKDNARTRLLLDIPKENRAIIWFRRYPLAWIVGRKALDDEILKLDLGVTKLPPSYQHPTNSNRKRFSKS